MSRKISIIIPCYNESPVIGSAITKVQSFFSGRGLDYEIIVVDDGSTDNTREVVQRFSIKLVKNERNRGKGFSVKRGAEESSGDLILFTDADFSTPIDEVDKLLPFVSDYDIIIGSRDIVGASVEKKQWWFKEALGKVGNRLIRFFLGLNIKDTQCGFKMFKKETLDIFQKQTIDRWGFDFELLFIAKKRGYKIKEVGVRWINDSDSKVQPSDYLKTFMEVLKVRINDWRGKYN